MPNDLSTSAPEAPRWHKTLCLAVVCSCVMGHASAANLLDVYERSLASDPLWQQAGSVQLAVRETKTQALLNLLPIDVSANKNWASAGNTTLNPPAFAALTLSVNLFSWDSWVALKAADASVAQGEANYRAAAQNLIQRVTQQYFSVLSAQDMLSAQQGALQSVQRQLDQALKHYEGGLVSRTDVEAARASHDSTAAAVIAAKRTLATQQNLLREITHENYLTLAAPREDMPLLSPEPAGEDVWVRTAMNQNADLIANRMAAEVAHDNLLTAYGGHLPSIFIGASRNWALQHLDPRDDFAARDAPFNVGFPTNTTDVVWQLGIRVPIFSAGATQSRVRQAHFYWDAAKSGVEHASRQAEEQTRDSYQGVISHIAQIQALRQAVESNRVSLQAAQAGYDVGTKTVVDVLTSRDALVQAELSYAQAKYNYLNDIVSLRLAAGTLDQSAVEQINSWLLEPAGPGASATTQ
jgi:outer membrane protein